MTLRLKNPCSICRKAGEKLFLKGDKCSSPHCPLLRRTYGPGQHGAKRRRISEYGSQLLEKQKLQAAFGISNRQLRNYYKKASKFKGKTSELFLEMLERRLDNVVFRGGLTVSRNAARKAITDGHIKVNGRKVDIPSYKIKIGDKVSLKDKSKDRLIFQDRPEKGYTPPTWLKVSVQNKEIEILKIPEMKDQDLKINISRAAEFYSR